MRKTYIREYSRRKRLKFTVAEIQNGRFTDLCAVGLGDIFREIA